MPAPKGNKNALKHGLYSRHFTTKEQESIGAVPTLDLRQEIYLVRMVLLRVQQTLGVSADPQLVKDMTEALAMAVSQINNLVRTQSIIEGKHQPLEDALQQALDKFRAERHL